MANKINKTVESLHGFLPFDPTHEQIYEEYRDGEEHREGEESLDLETSALSYLLEALQSQPRLLVLTGDAGHGKTHLCRRLLEVHLGYDRDRARELLAHRCRGQQLNGAPGTDKEGMFPLQIYKDLSELSVDAGAQALELAIRQPATTIICVNEGRLRAVLASSQAGPGCHELREAFRESFETGRAASASGHHIINLNFQSVAADGEASRNLLDEALAAWLHGSRWRTCADCDAVSYCPIIMNRRMLSPREDAKASLRRERLQQIIATTERLGTVITIRSLLMMVAYVLTGGLRCVDVHGKVARGARGWQHEYSFYSLLFANPRSLSKDRLARIAVLSKLRQIDPGRIARREVDDRLINRQDFFEPNELDLVFNLRIAGVIVLADAANGIDDIIGDPRSRAEREGESNAIGNVVRSIRRRYFFDQDSAEQGHAIRHLGFEHGDVFQRLLIRELEHAEMARVKSRLVTGLHSTQGMQLAAGAPLHLVDPAFGGTTAHAAIIARKIAHKHLKLLPRSSVWRSMGAEDATRIPDTVDWLERELVLVVEDAGGGAAHRYPINLLTFDLLMRAGDGYVAHDFYSHDLRHVLNFLGRLAETGREADQDTIDVIVKGHLYQVAIDEGDVIQVSGGI